MLSFFSSPPVKYMSVSEVHFSNAFLPTDVSVLGKIIVLREVQPEKVNPFNSDIPSGILMLLSALQPLNAAKPISLILLGSVILVIELHPLNAAVLIVVSGYPPKLSGRIISPLILLISIKIASDSEIL